MLNTLVLALAETTEHAGESHKWEIGGTALGILLFLLIMTMAFGGGREHS